MPCSRMTAMPGCWLSQSMESVETNGRHRNSGATWRMSSNACNIQKPSTLTVMSVRVLWSIRFSRVDVFLLSHDEAAHLNGFPAAPFVYCQAQLPPTAESVLDMLLPAVCTFWPWLFACS